MNHSPSDADLARASCAGDKDAFVKIVMRYQGRVTAITLAVLNDFPASEDAAQEAFVLAWKKMKTLRNPEKLSAWLGQLARHTALNHLRKRKKEIPVEDHYQDHSPTPDEAAASSDEEALTLKALENLPEKYRLPIILYYREDQSTAVVAKSLGLSEGTVRKQLSRGREMLRAQILPLVENVLPRTAPSSVFTMTVAGMIGAMLKPTAVAATAFSSSTQTATAVTTSKFSFTTFAVISALAIPAGYTAKMAFEDPVIPPVEMKVGSEGEPRFLRLINESQIVAEWRKLWAPYESNPGALPELWAQINTMPDGLRKQAFHVLLATEWARVDASGGSLFYRKGNQLQLDAFYKSWVKRDIDAAVEELVEGSNVNIWWISKAIARKSPEYLGRFLEKMPSISDSESLHTLFDMASQTSVEESLRAADFLSPELKVSAYHGIASGWGMRDSEAALAWARSFEDKETRTKLIQKVLAGWLREDAFGVLALLAETPSITPKYDETVKSSALAQAARQDFHQTLRWLAENASGYTGASALDPEISTRMASSPTQFLSEMEEHGFLPVLSELMSSGGMTQTVRIDEEERALWEWLYDSERSQEAKKFRKELSHRKGYQKPKLIMDLLENFKAGKERDDLWNEAIPGFFRSGFTLEKIKALVERRSPEFQSAVLNLAVLKLPFSAFEDANSWQVVRPLLNQKMQKRLDIKIKAQGKGRR